MPAVLAWLALWSSVASAQSVTYDAAADWLSTYSTLGTAAAATGATWGTGNAWSAGEMSWNWTNQQASTGNSSLQVLTTYYLPGTGYTSSATPGNVNATFNPQVASYSYTVPWQTYQFNPGQSTSRPSAETVTQQLALGTSGFVTKNGGRDSDGAIPAGGLLPCRGVEWSDQ